MKKHIQNQAVNFIIAVIIILCFSPKHVDVEQSVRQVEESPAPFANSSYISGCPQASELHDEETPILKIFTRNPLISISVLVSKMVFLGNFLTVS